MSKHCTEVHCLGALPSRGPVSAEVFYCATLRLTNAIWNGQLLVPDEDINIYYIN